MFFQIKAQVPNYYIRSYGSINNDEGIAIDQDLSNNIYATGYFSGNYMVDSSTTITSSGLNDIYIIKNDPEGNLIWAKKAGGGGVDRPSSLACDNSGNFYLTGFFSGTAVFDTVTVVSAGLQDFFIARYNSNGDLIYIKTGGGNFNEQGNSVTHDDFGNGIVTGQFSGSATFDTYSITSMVESSTQIPSIDVFIAKYDSIGNIKWIKKGSSEYTDRGLAICSDQTGNIYLSGQFSDSIQFSNTYNNNIYNATFILKLDSSGNEIWFQTIGGGISGSVYALKNDPVGNLIISGNTQGTTFLLNGTFTPISSGLNFSVYIIRLDSSGNLIQIKTFGSDCLVDSKGIAIDDSSNVYVTGNFQCKLNSFSDVYGDGTFNSAGFNDVYVAKFSPVLDLVWARNYGGPKEDESKGIIVNHFFQTIITGSYMEKMNYPITLTDFNFISYGLNNPNYAYLYGGFCNEPNDWEMFQIKSKGLMDAFISKPIKETIGPYYYYYNLNDSNCIRPYVKVEIKQGGTDVSQNIDSIDACYFIELVAATNTTISKDNSSSGPNFTYLWSTGDTTRRVTVNQSGDYWVRITSLDSCFSSSDTITAIVHPQPPKPLISDSFGINNNADSTQSLSLCQPDTVSIFTSNNTSYHISWKSQGSITINDTNLITLSQINNYFLSNPIDNSSTIQCIATDTNGCRNINIIQIQVDSLLKPIQPRILLFDPKNNNVPLFSDTVRICDDGSNNFDFGIYDSLLGIPPDNYLCIFSTLNIEYASFSWSIAPNCSNTSWGCDQVRNFNPQSPGWYSVSCIMIRNSPCAIPDTFQFQKDVFVVFETKPIVSATITGSSQICPGDTITLTASGGPYFQWRQVSPINIPLSNNSFINVTSPGKYEVIVSDTNMFGCYSWAIEDIIVAPPLIPEISINPANGIICPGDSIQLEVPAGYNYVWHGPSGIISQTSNTIYATYPGNYYCYIDSSSCYGNTNSIEITGYTTPFLSALPSTFLCPGASIDLQVTATPNSLIQWNSPLTGNSPIQIVNLPGTYSCQINSCSILTLDSVTIQSSPIAATILPSGPITLCEGDSVVLTANPGMSFYEWQSQMNFTPFLVVTNPGNYQVQTADNFGCTAISNIVIVTNTASPPLPVVITNKPWCIGDTMVITAINSQSYQIEWLLPNGTTSNDSTLIIYPAANNNNGTYTIIYSNGICTKTSYEIINIDSLNFGGIEISGDWCLGSISLTALNSGAADAIWTTPLNNSSTNATYLLNNLTPSDTGWYILSLQNGGCSFTDSAFVSMEGCEITIPNIFTPNGDGENDYFEVLNSDSKTISYKIFDRWGTEVFKSSISIIKWNGSYNNNGAKCPEDTYFYVIQIRDENESSIKRGTLKLLR